MEPLFLSLNEVLEIHQDQTARYGGTSGIRDTGLLTSALAMPSAAFGGEFLHTDLYEMAAAYLFHLVKNHPFLDGNKRTGAVAALVFLELNGRSLDVPEDTFAEMVLAAARGDPGKAGAAVFFRRWSKET